MLFVFIVVFFYDICIIITVITLVDTDPADRTAVFWGGDFFNVREAFSNQLSE